MFVGSCLITLKENPRVYPWIKIFSYGLLTQNHGEGERKSMSEICYVPGVSFTSRRVRKIKTVARRGLRPLCHSWHVKNKTNYELVLIMSVEKFFVSRDRHIAELRGIKLL